jgi:alpha-glucosidase
VSDEWWRHAVVYQVYPRSFADSNGDGMGDLPGVTAHLDYLQDLGVDAIWLSPFYTSPQNDGGYDVADYQDVDPRFGTLEDADTLIASAHAKRMKVIVDLVPNHSSSDHELFQRALEAGPGSPERDMYVFRDGKGEDGELPPNNWESIFHGPGWTRVTEPDGTPGQWYLHIFDTTQPDWNWDNPAVHTMFQDVLRFWLDRGADGFRVDVAHGMVKPEGLPDATVNAEGLIDIPDGEVPVYFDNDGVLDIYREWRPILDSYEGDRMMVLEAWIPEQRLPLYIGPDEAHQSFNFGFLQAHWGVDTMRAAIEKPLALAQAVGAPTTWVLSNHDVIRHASRYGFPADYRFGEGLRRDEVPDTEQGLRRARAATLLMLALPGAAYLYQGEELGLPEVSDLPDHLREDPSHKRAGVPGRDGCRVPLPWTAAGCRSRPSSDRSRSTSRPDARGALSSCTAAHCICVRGWVWVVGPMGSASSRTCRRGSWRWSMAGSRCWSTPPTRTSRSRETVSSPGPRCCWAPPGRRPLLPPLPTRST